MWRVVSRWAEDGSGGLNLAEFLEVVSANPKASGSETCGPCLLLNECQEMARNLLQEGSLAANTSPDAKKHRETIPWCHEPCLLFRVLAAQSIHSDPGQGRDLSAELIEAFKILDEDADGQRPSGGEDVKLRTGANTAKRTG